MGLRSSHTRDSDDCALMTRLSCTIRDVKSRRCMTVARLTKDEYSVVKLSMMALNDDHVNKAVVPYSAHGQTSCRAMSLSALSVT